MQAPTVIEPGLLEASEQFATDLLTNQLKPGFVYHTLDHTQQVVYACREIGINSGLSQGEIDILVMAAWFHDLGYLVKYDGHEEESMRMAREFLNGRELNPALLRQIIELIEATKLDHVPRNLMEKVIKDADLYNMATPEALDNSDAIRNEWVLFRQMELSDKKWEKFNLNFFRQHLYYTDYGKQVLEERKQKNIKKLKKRLKKLKKVDEEAKKSWEKEIHKREMQISKLNRKIDKIRSQRPDRGIETMFRVVYRTHINLSSIADNKANILLSINTLAIGFVFPTLLNNLSNLAIVIPSILLIIVFMTTIIFAILATRPKVSSGTFDREDIINRRTNLLFFGNFHDVELDDYLWGVDQMMQDSDYLYGSMSKDIYFLGKVLARKFQLLRLAYNMFMYGMIGVIAGTVIILMLDRVLGLNLLQL